MTRFGMDVGGTFTDLVALAPDGTVRIDKVRSMPGDVSPEAWAALDGLAEGRPDAAAALVHGSTVATNALLERRGSRVALLVTKGFEDLLWLRRQDRAALYDLAREHPPPLLEREDVIGVAERTGPEGVVLALSEDEVRRVVDAVQRRPPEALAIALLFSFLDDTHERRLAEAVRAALPDLPVVASAELLPVFREYERASTAVAEAFLRPLAGGYVERMGTTAAARGLAELRIMASNGGTLSVAQARDRAVALALSGPAGGVEGARLVGEQLGFRDLLTLDMGGTSADASIVVEGEPLMQAQGEVGGVPLALPHVLIETVGAGGGSIAWVDRGGALRVGPRSAGAVPGPACYGQSGRDATVTDAALLLGWLDAGQPLAGGLQLDRERAEEAVARVAGEAGLSVARCAEGIIEVANAAMVRALRRVSVERGIDPREMILVAFGGAGPLFACRMADALGMRRALVPPHAGVLSALGLAAAPARIEFVASLHREAGVLDATALEEAFGPLERAAEASLPGGATRRVADCRYPGQGYELMVLAEGDGATLAAAFHDAHRERFGHADEARAVDVVNVRVVATRAGNPVELTGHAVPGAPPSPSPRMRLADTPAGTVLAGPCMLDAPDRTMRIEPGWRGTIGASGALILETA